MIKTYAVFDAQGSESKRVRCDESLIKYQLSDAELAVEIESNFKGYLDRASMKLKPFPSAAPSPVHKFDIETQSWVDARPLEVMVFDERNKRDYLLAETDWTQAADVPEATKAKYQTYRQALRDVPQQAGFPDNIVWPTKPE